MKALYRIRQSIFALFIGIAQRKKTEIISRRGAVLEIPEILRKKEIEKVLVITTTGFVKRGTLEELFQSLNSSNIAFSLYTGVVPDPTVECIENGLKQYKDEKCQGIVAIGGGSVLDAAKIIAARANNPKQSVRKMKGMLKIKKPLVPYIPVPTTCGTGSEVTAAAVISDELDGMHYKYAITDLKLIPKLAVLDASLLDTLPKHMLATTAMDALTHALESYYNCFASKSVKKDALEAVKRIFISYPDAVNQHDSIAIADLLYASTLAGVAFTHNFVGYVHAFAHAMGAMYGLAHGYLNSIILPVVLKHYGEAIRKKSDRIAFYNGVQVKDSISYVLAKIQEFKRIADLPDRIVELKEADYDEILRRVIQESHPTYPVPVIMNKNQLRLILQELTIQEG